MLHYLRSLLLFLVLIHSAARAQAPVFSPEQLHANVRYLNKHLKRLHPACFRYTPERAMDSMYHALDQACSDSMSM